MAARLQDYVSDRGRLTTNTVESFYGLALVYETSVLTSATLTIPAKTNMAICHKVIGMGIDIPVAAVASSFDGAGSLGGRMS